ncbi:uncharacterized protein LOC121855442 [Homarus americanus]|uniref:uncharacterized protein LOC121855442 n=1 Tax=Homarus americanus TaxID=6706 RepID=UPI001C48468D|nr:uncharacterized protein LOC121855442 [Homarus americanus]
MASTSRDRGRGRKYLNGNQKRALAKAKVLENEKHRGAIKKFLVTPPLKRPCIEDEEDKNDSENDNTAISPITVDEYNEEIDIQFEKVQVDTQTQLNQTEDDLNTTEDSAKVRSPLIAKEESEGQAQTSNSDGSSTSTVVININDDPASWPSNINRNIRDYLTMKGPPDIPVNKFPRNEKGLCFSKFHCIDKERELTINKHAKYWQQVFKRLVAIVQFLAERNLALRGTEEKVGNESVHNGNFLGLVELFAKFDSVLEEHLRKVKANEIHNHYLGKDTQNELLDIMATAVLNEILNRVKAAKYYAIILDCTPDLSHQEQMSLTIRYVSDGNLAPSGVYEHFIQFMQVESSTGENLYKTLLNTLEQGWATLGRPSSNLVAAGFEVSKVIAQHGKPLSDGEYIKEAWLECAPFLFDNLSEKDKIIQRIKDLSE